jgi:hypothetical protein
MNDGIMDSVTSAVVTSLVASLIYGLLGFTMRGVANYRRARPFTGRHAMLGADDGPRGGTVMIEYSFWTGITGTAAVLTLIAEHGTGSAPGTENWEGQVEVLGFSRIASGFYTYPNRSGGALRLHLGRDGQTITEHGFPNATTEQPFTRTLRRAASKSV